MKTSWINLFPGVYWMDKDRTIVIVPSRVTPSVQVPPPDDKWGDSTLFAVRYVRKYHPTLKVRYYVIAEEPR